MDAWLVKREIWKTMTVSLAGDCKLVNYLLCQSLHPKLSVGINDQTSIDRQAVTEKIMQA